MSLYSKGDLVVANGDTEIYEIVSVVPPIYLEDSETWYYLEPVSAFFGWLKIPGYLIKRRATDNDVARRLSALLEVK